MARDGQAFASPNGGGFALWPLFTNQPAELMETYYPMRVEAYTSVIDSGGAGYHRGGNGLLKVYHFLAEGEVSIHDDRWLTYQWGVNGGSKAMRGKKWLDGSIEYVASKCDHAKVLTNSLASRASWPRLAIAHRPRRRVVLPDLGSRRL